MRPRRAGPKNQQRSHGGAGRTERRESQKPAAKPTGSSGLVVQKGERLTIGIHSVREALRVRPHAVRLLALRDDFERAPQLKELAELAGFSSITIKALSGHDLDALGSGHQGAAAILTENPTLDFEALAELKTCVLVACDGLEDPANLGSVLRSAWLLGAKGVLVPQDRSVSLTTAAAKVASGGAEHVPVEVVSNLPRELERLREAGFWIFGLAEAGKGRPWDFKLPEKIVWVVGSESAGLRVTVERVCDELVRLPQVEGGSSFNAAVALTMALYESARQRA